MLNVCENVGHLCSGRERNNGSRIKSVYIRINSGFTQQQKLARFQKRADLSILILGFFNCSQI